MTRALLFPLLALAIAAGIWWATMRDAQEDMNAIDPADSSTSARADADAGAGAGAGAGSEPARDATVTRRAGGHVTGTHGRAGRHALNLSGVSSA